MPTQEVILTLFKSAGGKTSLSQLIQQQLIFLHLLLRINVKQYIPPPPIIPIKFKIKISSNQIGIVIYIIIKYINYINDYESKTYK